MKYIQRNLKKITKHANGVINTRDFLDELENMGCDEDYTDFDYWDAYGDNVDLNFYGSADGTELLCVAYPVVKGVVDTSKEYETKITLEI